MASLGRLLGMLLATRMAGRGRFGSALGTAALLRGGLGRTAGLAGIAYMAYRAYQDGKASRPDSRAGAARQNPFGREPAAEPGLFGTLGNIIDGLTGSRMDSRRGEPGRGDEISNHYDPGPAEPAPPAGAAALDEQRALLLIRAMIAAANADGRISPQERRRILARLDEAGADAEEHRIIEQELDSPKSLEQLLTQVKDQDTAQQFHAASRAAMDGESPVQIAYLDYLKKRLDLATDETAEIDRAMR